MRSMRIHPGVRGFARAGAVPLLLLAAAGAAQAAGPDFQYVGQDDKVHGLTDPRGCVAAKGGGQKAVTNATRSTATLYRGAGCTGDVVAVLQPGAGGQIEPFFASVRFSFISKAQRP
ncbi:MULTISPECIES: hypothetical protein [unclassified Streptomyces]|uniref:hypothetical protein n=2 Tax=unclassified Streptomyces TaxID=2593676 RepID=UPI000A8A01B2|nr:MULTISPECIES: hypothetical protein [unclassified Streptomyces]MCX5151170.1 hypothetical protein [Streptomyces sp. NBC_00320]WSN47285.1 hypothetical protein OG299_06040 [Streptomyces sp. NBC_01296]WSW63468.1 hypothetical protein OG513_35580 [Streptomyces sp. NBC_00998]